MIDWKDKRKQALWSNIFILRFDKLFQKRDKRVWLFGGREGHQYDDNSRALFEWINQHHPEIKTAWICKEESLAIKIREYGFKAYTFDSIEGITFSKKAGVAFYTNGLLDFGYYPRVGGATIVSLWHGVGFKKIYNDTYHGAALVGKKLLDKLFSWTYRDITITTSRYVNVQFSSIFGLDRKAKKIICGQPRNDVFFSGLSKDKVLSKTSISPKKNLVLFMPTYRKPSMGKDAMTSIVRRLYECKELDNALNATNSVFVAKLHPLTPHIDIANRDNFVILDYSAVDNNQELLGIADMLITDYSSCIVDYALLDKPVVFYMPDHEKFINMSEPLYDEFFGLCKHDKCSTPEELAPKILYPSKAAVNAINELFEDSSIKGTCYCENVYNAIAKEVGL